MWSSKLVAVTPAKNEEEHIEKCVKSVLAQTHPATLHLIVDDSSNDRTVEVARKYPVKIISSGLKKTAKQHGMRMHLVQQEGIDKVTEFIPDWQYLLHLDGDCWIPCTYCEDLIEEMNKDQKLAMVGARYLQTPKGAEESSSIHVRSANHIIRRRFYDICSRSGRDYANLHGEMLLEKCAWINGWSSRTLPITAYAGRETGVTVADPFKKGEYDYSLGMPFAILLLRLRKPSKRRILQVCGWIRARIRRRVQYFDERERILLRRWYFEHLLKRIQFRPIPRKRWG